MIPALPDVNVLLAILFEAHQHHRIARAWFVDEGGRSWRTCAVTEMGFVRLASNPAWTSRPLPPRDAVQLLRRLTDRPGHAFVEPHVSCAGAPFLDLAPRLQGHRQVTDAWLLAMAEHHALELVSFDARLAHLSPFERRPRILPPGP